MPKGWRGQLNSPRILLARLRAVLRVHAIPGPSSSIPTPPETRSHRISIADRMPSPKKFAIVGAGVAGLLTATQLRAAGGSDAIYGSERSGVHPPPTAHAMHCWHPIQPMILCPSRL